MKSSWVRRGSRRAAATAINLVAGRWGVGAERFGDQAVQMLGAAEHRSARICPCASEERRPQQRRWAAWAPKIRRPSSSAIRPVRRKRLLDRTVFAITERVLALEDGVD